VATYAQFLGVVVKVQYRLGDILLSATGTFVGDSGRSIFLEQHVEQRGKRNYFRWEIPYPYIHKIEVIEGDSSADAASKAAAASAGVAGPASRAASVIPFPQRRKMA
jgi:hypothetical protein